MTSMQRRLRGSQWTTSQRSRETAQLPRVPRRVSPGCRCPVLLLFHFGVLTLVVFTVYPTYANAKEATAMLMERIDTLIAVLRATQAGEVPTDHEMLRKISAICAQLPTTRSEAFESAFLSEFNDSMLVTYLSTMTKSAHQLSELLSKVQAGYPRGRDRGAFGFMM